MANSEDGFAVLDLYVSNRPLPPPIIPRVKLEEDCIFWSDFMALESQLTPVEAISTALKRLLEQK